MATVNEMLDEREARYGSFEGHSAIAQELKNAMWVTEKWGQLSDVQREALEMVQHKIARILNGDVSYQDNWIDLIGYAQLALNHMQANTPANLSDYIEAFKK